MNIKGIAKETGYSESTVSRALNNDPRISTKTTKIIQKMAAKLNYQKDFAAVNLNHPESNIIAIIFPPEDYTDINNPFYIEIIKQASAVADQYGYMISIIMAENQERLGQKIDMMCHRGKVRKFIMLYNLPEDPIREQLLNTDSRLVVIGDPHDDRIVFVDNNNYQVGRATGARLIEHGFAGIPVYLMSSRKWEYEVDRQRGLADTLREGGWSLQTIVVDPQKVVSNTELMRLEQAAAPLVVSSDNLLTKLYSILKWDKIGPVVSFNNTISIQPVGQTIASIDLHPQEIGSKAATLLFDPQFDQVERANFVGFTL